MKAGGMAEPPGKDQNAQGRACGDNSGSLHTG
jgi:hypothetical protein